MLTAQSKELLRNLRAGKLDASVAAFLEQLAADDFIADLRRYYPVLFQERNIGLKHEIGLARSRFEVVNGSIRNDDVPVLLKCLLISSYGDSLSGLEALSSIRIVPPGSPGADLTLASSRGFKLDKTTDGWLYRQTERSCSRFSKSFLTGRVSRSMSFDQFGPPNDLLTRPSRRRVFQAGSGAARVVGSVAAGGGCCGWSGAGPAAGEALHPRLFAGRTAASRHVGSQARGAGGNSRAF